MGSSIDFKIFLGFQIFFHSGCLLEVCIVEAGKVINKNVAYLFLFVVRFPVICAMSPGFGDTI